MLVADYLCFCLLDIQLCSAELAQLVLAGLLTLFNYLSSAGVIWFIKFMYFLWRRFYVLIIIILVFLDEGFVMIWVELPSSAPILWFDVLSLVSWVAGLPSASDVLSGYLQSAWGSHFVEVLVFFWTELCVDLLVVQGSCSCRFALSSASNVLSEYFQSCLG